MSVLSLFTNLFKGAGAGVAGDAASAAAATMGKQTQSALGLQGSITGGLLGGFSAISNMFDIKNDPNMSKTGKKMGTADSAVDAVAAGLSFIPGVGNIAGAALSAVNQLGKNFVKDPTKSFTENTDVTSSGAFGGVTDNVMNVNADKEGFKNAGLVGRLFGKKDLKSGANIATKQQALGAGVLNESKKAFANQGSASMFDTRNTMNKNGIDFNAIRFGKEGTKIIAKQIVEKFKGGGVVGKNVILDGALHARKHTLKDLEEYADASITEKGIPVIVKNEDGGVTQHAEVEKDELVLHYSLTNKIEKLYKDGSEEAMLEAGKLLTIELLKNTVDSKTKLLKQ